MAVALTGAHRQLRRRRKTTRIKTRKTTTIGHLFLLLCRGRHCRRRDRRGVVVPVESLLDPSFDGTKRWKCRFDHPDDAPPAFRIPEFEEGGGGCYLIFFLQDPCEPTTVHGVVPDRSTRVFVLQLRLLAISSSYYSSQQHNLLDTRHKSKNDHLRTCIVFAYFFCAIPSDFLLVL